jgi:hypothetical protein
MILDVQLRALIMRSQPWLACHSTTKAGSHSRNLHSVTLDVSGELIHDHGAELRVHLARQ